MAHSGHKETHAWGRHKARERYAEGGKAGDGDSAGSKGDESAAEVDRIFENLKYERPPFRGEANN